MSEPIGQTTTTSLIRLVLAAYPGMGWNGKNAKRYRVGFFGGDKLVKKQAYPRPDRQLQVSPSLLNFPRSSARAV